jgi:hypothetical protein
MAGKRKLVAPQTTRTPLGADTRRRLEALIADAEASPGTPPALLASLRRLRAADAAGGAENVGDALSEAGAVLVGLLQEKIRRAK